MFEILYNNIHWIFSGVGCVVFSFFYRFFSLKTSWINVDNSYFVKANRDISYGYIVPDNYHPISSKQYCNLINNSVINEIEENNILENINEKHVIWKLRLDGIKKYKNDDHNYLIDGVIKTFSARHPIKVYIKQNLENIDTKIKLRSNIYVIGKAIVDHSVKIVDAQLLSYNSTLL